MHHYLGRDPIAEFWRGEITLRKLRVMVEGLPPNGALARAVAGHHWQQRDWHGADMVDLLGRVLTVLINANRGEKASAIPYPEAVWRPDDKARAKAKKKKAAQDRTNFHELVAAVTPRYARRE